MSENISKFNEEKILYEEFKKINGQLNEEKQKLKKYRESYHKEGAETESKIIIFVQNNNEQLSDLSEEKKQELEGIIYNNKKSLKKYKKSINKVNQLVDEFNNKHIFTKFRNE